MVIGAEKAKALQNKCQNICMKQVKMKNIAAIHNYMAKYTLTMTSTLQFTQNPNNLHDLTNTNSVMERGISNTIYSHIIWYQPDMVLSKHI